MKGTFTLADGSTVDLFDQAYTDAAVAAAKLVVAPETTEVDLELSDGSTKKFVPAA